MILQKKLELKLKVVGLELKAGYYGSFFHIKNVSEQELIWEDGSDIQEFYVFPNHGIDDDSEYEAYESFMDYKQIPIYECKQIDCLYEDVDDFFKDMKELVKSYCEENKIPYKFMDHYFDGDSINLECVNEIIYDGNNEGVCNEDDKYKRFKWKYDEESSTVKIYDNIIVSDMEEKVTYKKDVIKFFNKFADTWNNAIVGKYER